MHRLLHESSKGLSRKYPRILKTLLDRPSSYAEAASTTMPLAGARAIALMT